MNEIFKDKLNFIVENYELFRSLHYSFRLALLECVIFNVDKLTDDSKKLIIERYKLFSKISFADNLSVYEELPNNASYESVILMLIEYKDYLEYLLKLNISNKNSINKKRSIICSILHNCNKLCNIDINRRK